MTKKPPSFAKAAPIKSRRERVLIAGSKARSKAIEFSDGLALKHLNIGVNWFDDKGFPEPWVWASALTLHLFLTAILIAIPPAEFKDPQVFGVEIITQPPPQEIAPKKLEPTKTEPKIEVPTKLEKIAPELEKPVATEAQVAKFKFEPKAIAPIIEAIPSPASVRIPPPEELEKIEPILPKNIEKKELINRKLVPVPKVAPIDAMKFDENYEAIDEIKNLDKVTLAPAQKLIFRDNNRIEPKASNSAAPISLGSGALKGKNSIVPSINPNLLIDEEKLIREAQAREAERFAKEKSALEQSAREQTDTRAATKAANTAPIAKNGELAPSSGAGVTAIAPIVGVGRNAGPNSGGSNAPNGGGSQNVGGSTASPNSGNGTLPRGPRIVGNGRNVFENNENGSLLARMARTADCSSINRERDEKCPNWQPLEKATKAIPAPVPKNATRPQTGVDPLPECPIGTPQSNMGRTCLPSKSAPNGRKQ